MRYVMTLILASTSPAWAEVPRVVTDIPPVHALGAQVMGDLGAPELLLTKGADEHDFQLRPSQAGAVADADLVVWIGPDLTPWLESAMETRPQDAAALALLMADGTLRRDYGAKADAHAHAEEAAHNDDHSHDHAEDDHAHEGHDHSGTDPHAWLDPTNAKVWLGLIADELSRLDPENAAVYGENAVAAAAQIDALDSEVAALLAPVAGKPIVTFHDAYGYYGSRYGLNLAGSIALGDAASPGAARLSELRATMESGAVLCIFPEVQHDPALVEQMAEGTGARIGGALDPVGATLDAGPGAYAALIRGTAQTIADCMAE